MRAALVSDVLLRIEREIQSGRPADAVLADVRAAVREAEANMADDLGLPDPPMVLKSLFDEHEIHTPEAGQFAGKVRRAVEPLVKEMRERGFRLRDAQFVAEAEIAMIVSTIVLGESVDRMRKRQAQAQAPGAGF